MSESKANASSSGIGLGGVLFVVFLTLKLAEVGVVATWSWWWITAPLWVPIGGIVLTAVIAALVVGVLRGMRAIPRAIKRRKQLRTMMEG